MAKSICPICGGQGVRIAYGLPNAELFEAAERGEVALGGCVIDKNDRNRRCHECGHEWDTEDGPPLQSLNRRRTAKVCPRIGVNRPGAWPTPIGRHRRTPMLRRWKVAGSDIGVHRPTVDLGRSWPRFNLARKQGGSGSPAPDRLGDGGLGWRDP